MKNKYFNLGERERERKKDNKEVTVCSPLHVVVGPLSHSIVGVPLLLGVGPCGILQIVLELAVVPKSLRVTTRKLVSPVRRRGQK